MVFIFPDNRKEVADRARTDVQNNLEESNPFLRNSFLDSIIVGFSGRVFDFYLQLKILTAQMFPDTATGAFLERWGSYKNITRNPATRASGPVTFIGVSGTPLPLGSSFTTSDGFILTTTSASQAVASTFTALTLERVGTVATVVLTDATPALSSGQKVIISGANEADYNGEKVITLVSANSFTFTVENSPVTPATGTIVASYNGATASVESEEFGQAQNLLQGTAITLTSPIASLEDVAYVQFGAVGGGTDIESDEDLRARIIDRYQNPISLFNVAAITTQAKSVSGVTRVFVNGASDSIGDIDILSITRPETGGVNDLAIVTTNGDHGLETSQQVSISGATDVNYDIANQRIIVLDNDRFAYKVIGDPVSPAVPTGAAFTSSANLPAGQVLIYIMRDNDGDPIPDASEVSTTKDKILEIKPAATADIDVLVRAPAAVSVNITLTSMTPNNTTMQNAVKANLEAFFRDETAVAKTVTLKQIESTILQTVDPATATAVSDFTMSVPAADVTPTVGQIATLGTVSFL